MGYSGSPKTYSGPPRFAQGFLNLFFELSWMQQSQIANRWWKSQSDRIFFFSGVIAALKKKIAHKKPASCRTELAGGSGQGVATGFSFFFSHNPHKSTQFVNMLSTASMYRLALTFTGVRHTLPIDLQLPADWLEVPALLRSAPLASPSSLHPHSFSTTSSLQRRHAFSPLSTFAWPLIVLSRSHHTLLFPSLP